MTFAAHINLTVSQLGLETPCSRRQFRPVLPSKANRDTVTSYRPSHRFPASLATSTPCSLPANNLAYEFNVRRQPRSVRVRFSLPL